LFHLTVYISTKISMTKTLLQYKYYVSGHYPSTCFYLKYLPVYISTHDVSKTGFCLRLQLEPSHLGPIDRASPYLRSIDWAKLSRFYFKTETEPSTRNVVCWNINRAMNDVQKRNICRHKLLDLIYTVTGMSLATRSCFL
jgi:hypothetical protein